MISYLNRQLKCADNRLLFGVDFSKQPNNEIWYRTVNDTMVVNTETNLIGGWMKQEGL